MNNNRIVEAAEWWGPHVSSDLYNLVSMFLYSCRKHLKDKRTSTRRPRRLLILSLSTAPPGLFQSLLFLSLWLTRQSAAAQGAGGERGRRALGSEQTERTGRGRSRSSGPSAGVSARSNETVNTVSLQRRTKLHLFPSAGRPEEIKCVLFGIIRDRISAHVVMRENEPCVRP